MRTIQLERALYGVVLSCLRRVLVVFGILACLAPFEHAEAKCPPHATIGGDASARAELTEELDAGGVVIIGEKAARDSGCGTAIRVRIERMGATLLVTAVDRTGAWMQRSTSSVRAAATIVEAWALGAQEAEDAIQLAEGRLSNRVRVRAAGDTGFSLKGRPAWGASAAVLAMLDRVELGMELHVAKSSAGFFEQIPTLFDRSLILTISYHFSIDNLVVAPELGLGAGIGTSGSLGFSEPESTATTGRERLAVRVLYPFDDNFGFDGAAFALLQGDPTRISSSSAVDDLLGVTHGILSFGVTAGVWWRP